MVDNNWDVIEAEISENVIPTVEWVGRYAEKLSELSESDAEETLQLYQAAISNGVAQIVTGVEAILVTLLQDLDEELPPDGPELHWAIAYQAAQGGDSRRAIIGEKAHKMMAEMLNCRQHLWYTPAHRDSKEETLQHVDDAIELAAVVLLDLQTFAADYDIEIDFGGITFNS